MKQIQFPKNFRLDVKKDSYLKIITINNDVIICKVLIDNPRVDIEEDLEIRLVLKNESGESWRTGDLFEYSESDIIYTLTKEEVYAEVI